MKLKASILILLLIEMVFQGFSELNASDKNGKNRKPNLLVIYTDEHNFRTLGCYRDLLSKDQAEIWGEGNVVETPNIDWLAKNGALCNKFYVSTPICSPSRSSLMTGMYPQNTPVVENDIVMDTTLVTFAKALRNSGYNTGYAGKWHLSGKSKPGWEPKYDYGFTDNRYMFNRGHWKQIEDTPKGPAVSAKDGKPIRNAVGDEKTFTTDWLTDKTIEFLKNAGDDPFCYMVSIPDPHGPDVVREPYKSMYQQMDFKMPGNAQALKDGQKFIWSTPEKGNKSQAVYFGMVKCIDDNVGKILDYLRESGLIKNTIVVFTSDHGDLRGEHMRQDKGVPFEASLKVPFIVHYPPVIEKGTVVNEALNVVDFHPTILSLMGIKSESEVDGRDASALLISEGAPKNWKDMTFARGSKKKGWICAVTPQYKLVFSITGTPVLFDLEADPNELNNYFRNPDYRSIIRDLGTSLYEYMKNTNDPYIKNIKMVKDIKWCMGNETNYKVSSE